MNSPQKYAGKQVEVRARIHLAFEDFTLAHPGCEGKFPGIWLIYGGDVPTPTPSTVNDLERKPGSVLKIDRHPIPLVHDDALDLFRKRLSARRSQPIGTRPCYDCYLYRVTATVTGSFFAASEDHGAMTGYGHLGCCSLLAIQRVADVVAERTEIPSGGSYRCLSESRKLDSAEAQRLKDLDRDCTNLTYEQCTEIRRQQMAAATTAYWNDSVPALQGTMNGGEISGNTDTEVWESADKLKTYTLVIESEDPLNPRSQATGGSITRETCRAVMLRQHHTAHQP